MTLREQLAEQARRLMRDPRVMRALQNPRFMQGMVGAVQLRAKLQHNVDAGVQRLAKRLSLATEAEVRELRRTVRRLERELEAHRSTRSANGGGEFG